MSGRVVRALAGTLLLMPMIAASQSASGQIVSGQSISGQRISGQNAANWANAQNIRLFGRTLSFQLPAGIVLVSDQRNSTHVLMEFIPRNETLSTWTRMTTVQAYRGLGASPETSAVIARRAFYPEACTIGADYIDSGEIRVAHGLSRSVISVACASLPAVAHPPTMTGAKRCAFATRCAPVEAYPLAMTGAGEQDFIFMYRDRDTIYTLNYAQRGVPFVNKPPPRHPADAAATLGLIFGDVTLCRSNERCGRKL
jgi:hypothetical protein